jgi:hypothetical protein
MRPKLIRRRRRFPRNRICLSDTPRSRLFIGPRLHSSSNHPREINVDERTRELQPDPRKVHLEERRRSMIIRGRKRGVLAESRQLSRALARPRSGCAPDTLGDARPRVGPAYLPPGRAISPHAIFSSTECYRPLSLSLSLSLSLVRSFVLFCAFRRFPAEKLQEPRSTVLCATALLWLSPLTLCFLLRFLEFSARNF